MSVCSDVDVNSASPCCIALGSCLAKSSDKFLQAFHVLVFKDWRYQFAFFAVRSCNTDILLEFPFSAVRIPCAPCFVAISSCCVLVSACAEEISGKLGGFLTGNAVHLNLNADGLCFHFFNLLCGFLVHGVYLRFLFSLYTYSLFLADIAIRLLHNVLHNILCISVVDLLYFAYFIFAINHI